MKTTDHDRTEAAPKPAPTDGRGSPVLPSRAMDTTDAAILRGSDRSVLVNIIAAERRAWNQYATDLARQVIRETLAELTK